MNLSPRLASLARLAVILGVVSLLPTASHFAYAEMAAQGVIVPGIPSQLLRDFGRDTRLDSWNPTPTLKDTVIPLSTDTPVGSPGTQPMPKFSRGINTPTIVSEDGANPFVNKPVQIADDAVVHGFLDAHEGIINTDTYTPCVGCPSSAQPVLFHDSVSIKPVGGAGGTALSVQGEITASHLLVSGGQGIDVGPINGFARMNQSHQLTGNVQLLGGTVTIASPLNLVGVPLNISNTAANATPTKLTGPLDIGPGFDTRIYSNRLIIGRDPNNAGAGLPTVDITANTTIRNGLSVEPGPSGVAIRAPSFGFTYSVSQGASGVTTTNWASNTGTCDLPNDVVTMCQMDFPGLADPPKDIQMYTTTGTVNGLASCTVKARKTNAVQANFNISARFTCNNTRGERAPGRF